MKLEDIGWSVLRAFSDGIDSANNAVKKHTGKSIFERMQETEKKTNNLKVIIPLFGRPNISHLAR